MEAGSESSRTREGRDGLPCGLSAPGESEHVDQSRLVPPVGDPRLQRFSVVVRAWPGVFLMRFDVAVVHVSLCQAIFWRQETG